jgi:hydroxyacylglutathione hydrolase
MPLPGFRHDRGGGAPRRPAGYNVPMRYQVIPVTPFEQNCSLIWCERTGRAALVDPGGEADLLLEAVEQQGVVLEKVLLTHGHLDHVGAAREIATRLGIPIEGPHRDDRFWLQALPQQSEMFGFPHADAFEPDRWLEEGETVRVGELELEVFHCPGHTPGHVVFYHPESKVAYVGDVLFRGSIGRTDFPLGDHEALIRSIREKLLPLGDDVQFVPGHGPESTFGVERLGNPYVADRRR